MPDRESPKFVKNAIDALASKPVVFDALRWILEAGYAGEKRILRQEKILEEGRVLDLGCGTGALTKLFDPKRYVGVDASATYIAHAKKTKPRHEFHVMDARRLALDPQSFDAVLISGVLHHLDDADAAQILSEVSRVLKPGTGRLVMWEDVPVRHSSNWIGRLVHYLDEGEHIRPATGYISMIKTPLRVEHHYFMSSGVCDYVVITARKGGI